MAVHYFLLELCEAISKSKRSVSSLCEVFSDYDIYITASVSQSGCNSLSGGHGKAAVNATLASVCVCVCVRVCVYLQESGIYQGKQSGQITAEWTPASYCESGFRFCKKG